MVDQQHMQIIPEPHACQCHYITEDFALSDAARLLPVQARQVPK